MGNGVEGRGERATSGIEVVTATLMIPFARFLIREVAERHRKQLFEACMSNRVPSDLASEVSTKVICMALGLEA